MVDDITIENFSAAVMDDNCTDVQLVAFLQELDGEALRALTEKAEGEGVNLLRDAIIYTESGKLVEQLLISNCYRQEDLFPAVKESVTQGRSNVFGLLLQQKDSYPDLKNILDGLAANAARKTELLKALAAKADAASELEMAQCRQIMQKMRYELGVVFSRVPGKEGPDLTIAEQMSLTPLLEDSKWAHLCEQNEDAAASGGASDITSVDEDLAKTLRFFRINSGAPLDTSVTLEVGKGANALYQQFFAAHQSGNPEANPVNIQGYSARSFIMALVKRMREENAGEVAAATGQHKFKIYFRLGGTTMNYDWRPHIHQKGNCFFKAFFSDNTEQSSEVKATQFGNEAVKGVMNFLNPILDLQADAGVSEREKELAKLMLKRARVFKSFTVQDFNQAMELKLPGEGSWDEAASADPDGDKDVLLAYAASLDMLNILWFVIEAARRLHGHCRQATPDPVYLDKMPIPYYLAKALTLVADGQLRIRDVFGVSAYSDELIQQTFHGYSEADLFAICEKAEHFRAKYGVTTGQRLTSLDSKNAAEWKQTQVRELAASGLWSEYRKPVAGGEQKTTGIRTVLAAGYGTASESEGSDHEFEAHALEEGLPEELEGVALGGLGT